MLETQTQIIGAGCQMSDSERIDWLQIYADSLQSRRSPDFTAIAKEIVSQEGYIEDVVSQVEAILRREFA
jgi:hypothetical protein